MKYRLLLIPAILVILLGVSSCTTSKYKASDGTGTERAEAASLTMELVESDIRLLVIEIGATNAALQTLIQPGQADIVGTFKEYKAASDSTKNTTEKFFAHSEKQDLQINAYFAVWQEEGRAYEDSAIQASSEERRSKLNEFEAAIADSKIGIRGSLNNYVSTTEQIQTFLSTDLTEKGVTAIAPVAQGAIADGVSLIASLESLSVTIATFRGELSSNSDSNDDPLRITFND